MRAFSAQRIAGVLGLALCLLGAGCTLDDDQVIPAVEPATNAFGLDEDASAEDLYFQALRLHSAGLVRRERMEQLQRQLAVVDEVYAEDPSHEWLLHEAILAQLRLAAAEVPPENRALLEAQEGRAYGRRLHRAGVRAAARNAEGMVLVAGMLGVPTSEEDALLMVAIPAGGFLVVKIGGMALKRAAFLLRSSRNTDEAVENSARLGFDVQRVEDASALRTAVASENESLAANFEELAASIPQTNAKAMVDLPFGPVTSMRNVEVRSQASRSTVVEMSDRPRSPQSLPGPALKNVNQREFSRWIRRAERQPARISPESYRYQ